MRFLDAFNRFMAVLFLEICALAFTESFGGVHVDPFGSRARLFYAALGLALLAVILRWRSLGATAATPRSAIDAHTPMNRVGSGSPTEPPPTDLERATAMIDRASHQAILFRQYFPPPHDDTRLSFFGGVPVAPRDFVWPRDRSGDAPGAPLHFFLQIDCAAIPETARLGALPATGVLYLFLDLHWGEGDGYRVIHLPLSDALQAHTPPADLGPVYGSEARHLWPWTQTQEQAPALLPKWPFEPVAIQIPEAVYAGIEAERDEEENSPRLWPGEKVLGDRLVAAQGGEVRSDPFTIKDFHDGASLRRPFPVYPQDWRAVQIAAAALVERATRGRRYPERWMFPDLEPDARDAHLAAIAREAQSWFDRAVTQPPFAAVPQPDRDAFWTFLSSHHTVAQFVLEKALTNSVEASLAASAETAARIPSELVARLRGRHAFVLHTPTGVFTTTLDRMLAPPIDIQGNQYERAQDHLLLFEFSSNDGLGHHFGEGVYQFWIRPEDLDARHFHRVVLTRDAY